MVFYADPGWKKIGSGVRVPVLLDEAHGDDDDNGERDAGGIVKLLHDQADKGGAEEEDDERVLELFQVLLPHRLLLTHHQLVQTKGLVSAQTKSIINEP